MIRLATAGDVPAVRQVMRASIESLQRGFLTDEQIRASHAFMGLDTQLIEDATYYVVEPSEGGGLAGCGGWSRRNTLYGGDHSEGRNAVLLDPASEPARIRAMYTHPAHTRRGVARLILETCEEAAAAEGYKALELMATLAGVPLYERAGFAPSTGSRTAPAA